MTDIIKPQFINSTNANGDNFVGIRGISNSIKVYLPECFSIDSEDFTKDVFLLLRCIKLSKIVSANDELANSKDKNGLNTPILSYIWIINDYRNNGFMKNREDIKVDSIKGRIDWKKTMQQDTIISSGNIIYTNFISNIKTNLDNEIIEIYKYCLKISIDRIGWLYKMKSNFIHCNKVSKTKLCYYISILKKELRKIFDDIKRERLSNMLQILENVNDNFGSNNFEYGTYSFFAAFEKMIDCLFNGVDDRSEYNPRGTWELENKEPFKSSTMRPDTIIKKDNELYIIDSKYYRYGATGDINNGLPDTQSIQKQITYAKHAFENNNKLNVYNAFLLPFDKNDKKNSYNGNLAWIGKATTDWEKEGRSYEKIHTFLIDLRFVIENYNKDDNSDIIDLFKNEVKEHSDY